MTVGIGQDFAGYHIEALIGEGGMGVVYLAEHLRLQRKVALKVVRPELAQDPDFRERFVREARMAAALEHPNIIPVYDAGEVDGILYLAMRFIRGTDLKDLIRDEQPVPVPRVLGILDQIASALDAAHEQGLVHRDVKPRNILVARGPGGRDHAFLTDFGLTKRTQSGSGLTRAGLFVGTLDYAAPEQIQARHIDGRADEYALTCVLYECLSGVPPFARDSDVSVMYAHLQEPPPPITSLRADLPPALDAVIARGMAKDPNGRYGTCQEMVAAAGDAVALPGMAEHGSTAGGAAGAASRTRTMWAQPPPLPVASATPVSGTGAGTAAATDPAAGTVPQTAPVFTGPVEEERPSGRGEPPRRGRGWLYAGIAAVLVALAAGGIVLAASHHGKSSAVSPSTPATTHPTTPASTQPSTPSSTPPTSPSTTPPVSPTGSALPLSQAVPSRFFSMNVPGDWSGQVDTKTPDVGDRCAPPQTFFDTHLTDPTVQEFGVIVDVTPSFAGDVSTHIHCQAAHQGGPVVSTTFHGLPAFQWTRAVGTSHGIDIQFEEGGTLFALYLVAPNDSFAKDVPTLNAIADSFLPAPPFVP